MLFGLLSGVRSARSPLIVGYVVLASLWLLLFHLFPESSGGLQKQYPEVQRIFSIIGPVGTVAALSLAAYLVGDLVVRESARLLQIRGQPPVEASASGSRQFLRKVFSFTHDAEMDELEERLDDLVDRTMLGGEQNVDLDRLREDLAEKISTKQGRSLKGFRVLSHEDAAPARLALNEQVRVEAKSGRIDERILAENPELYGELSRLRGEAEFRAGLLPALALLFVAIGFRVPWAWWVLAGISARGRSTSLSSRYPAPTGHGSHRFAPIAVRGQLERRESSLWGVGILIGVALVARRRLKKTPNSGAPPSSPQGKRAAPSESPPT